MENFYLLNSKKDFYIMTDLVTQLSNVFTQIATDIKDLNIQIADANLNGGGGISINGDTSCFVNETKTYIINNYSAFDTYNITISAGSVTRKNEVITITAPSSAQTITLTINKKTFNIEVKASGVVTPTIVSPNNGSVNQNSSTTVTISGFQSQGASDTLKQTTWEVATDAGFSQNRYTYTNTSSSYTFSGLQPSQTYYWRAKYSGHNNGDSAWVSGSFSTKVSFGGLVGEAGSQGFGVCECPDIDNLQWINAMPGHNEKSSENYGNYQTLNGSVMVCIPKFFYRWGNTQSPNYAKYGMNALDIVGADVFSSESEANAAGYALHRAFIDNGQEQPYFFIDKYLCSKDGNNSCKSVKNGNPISLTTSTGYNPSNGMTGCTGIYADAVVLARARGATFNCMSIFQQNAIAMLSLAHGQAATSTNYCAWYDAAGTKNYPKGCNNGSLADCDDTSVRFTSAGNSGSAQKPQAGSGNPFAKTTHNGQACGVADINGSLFQVMLGITNAGTSATDTTQNKTNNAYVWKRSTKFSTITGGWNGSTDAWGTASSLANNYDFVTGIFNNYAMGGQRVGNGTNGVFSSAVSGTDWLKTCCGITTSNGYSSNGTNTFGVDYYYEYNRANMFPLCSCYWYDSAYAGVWYRNFTIYCSSNNNSVGFRAAAYKN